MKYIKSFENHKPKDGYWIFEPLGDFSASTSSYPTDKFSKEEAIKYFSAENNIKRFKPVYFKEK